jgi:Tfp pilus assembly protein PilE
MSRHLILVVLFVTCLAILACQSNTSGLQQSVERGDETAAISALHTILAAQRTYSISNNGSYGSFPQLVKAGALDQRFNSDTPRIRGYILAMTVTSQGSGTAGDSFTVKAAGITLSTPRERFTSAQRNQLRPMTRHWASRLASRRVRCESLRQDV